MNVIKTSIEYKTPITIAISTDKACEPSSVYGMSKSIMEKCFVESNTSNVKFAACRFANIAFSNGSVLPYWYSLQKKNKSLELTDPKMNRLIFSKYDSSQLLNKSINLCLEGNGGFFSAISICFIAAA